MWGEKREGEGNQTPKFPFSIKRKISKNLGLSSKVYNFFDFRTAEPADHKILFHAAFLLPDT